MTTREQPCPYRIVDDFGSGFSMGCVAGCIFYFARGMFYSPKSQRFYGGVMLLKKRAPILGGSFALWAGLFSITDCALISIRNTEDSINQITAGAVTGGLLAFRAGARIALKNAMFGGIILAAIRVVQVAMIKINRKKQLQQQHQIQQKQMREKRRQFAKIRPDLFSEDGRQIMPPKKNAK